MELSISVDTREADRLYARYPTEMTAALVQATDDGQKLILRELQLYPAKRSSQRYVRTETLKRSWHVRPIRKVGLQVIGEVVSSGQTAPYNVWVQKAGMQAAVHVGRWRNTDRGVLERLRGHLREFVRVRVAQAAARLR